MDAAEMKKNASVNIRAPHGRLFATLVVLVVVDSVSSTEENRDD